MNIHQVKKKLNIDTTALHKTQVSKKIKREAGASQIHSKPNAIWYVIDYISRNVSCQKTCDMEFLGTDASL